VHVTATEAEARPHPHHVAAEPSRIRPEVPTLVLIVAAAVLLVNVVVMFLGAWSTGISWDEPIHVLRLEQYFATEWYLPPWQMVGDQPAPGVDGLYVYGPVAALTAHAVAAITGAEGWGESTLTAEAYAARHLAVAGFALLGIAAVGVTARLLLRTWRWALVAAAILSAIPAWTGHGMFNIKDTPVAAGYSLVTLGLVALARPGGASAGRLRILGVGALALGTVVSVGTRPGMWVPVVLTAVGMLVLTFWADSTTSAAGQRGTRLAARGMSTLAGLATGGVVLLAVYPQLFSHPDRLLAAVADSSEYPWNGVVLTDGVQVAMPPPPSYLPLWFAAQTPIVILALSVTGLVATAVLLVGALLRRRPGMDAALAVGSGLVVLQALLMPVAGVLKKAVLYDATRQVLFVVPALAMLAALGAWVVVRRLRRSGPRLLRVGFWVAVVLGVAVPTATVLPLFPYSYSWFNGITAVRGIDGRWMTEYWRTSARELVPLLPADGAESCGPWEPALGLNTCSTQPQFEPYWDTRGTAAAPSALGPGDYYYLAFNRGEYQAPTGCSEVGAVRRTLFGRNVTMSLVSRCSVPLAEYPDGGVTTAGQAGRPYLLWGWYPAEALGVWSRRPDAQIGFLLPERLRGQDVRLTVVAAPYVPPGGSQTVTFSVNGVEQTRNVYASKQNAGSVEMVVPAEVAWSGDGRFAVTVTASTFVAPASVDDGKDGRPLGVAVGRVTVEGAS
jgi:hypothetical protein